MQVDLDAFSGHPNPRWELSSEQAAEYSTRFRALRPAPSPGSSGDGLGYRGFIVRTNGEEVRFYLGIAVVQRSGQQEVFADPGRAFEHWLLETARPPRGRRRHDLYRRRAEVARPRLRAVRYT